MNKLYASLLVLLASITTIGAGCGDPKETVPVPTTPQVIQLEQPATPVNNQPSEPVISPSAEETAPTSTATPLPPTSTTPIPGTSTVTITQWGVKLAIAKDIVDLHYTLKNEGGKGYAYLSTRSVYTKGGDQCKEEHGPLGALVRSKTIESDGPMAAPTNAVKIGEYYYYYVGPQATCTTDQTLQNLIDKQKKLVEQAVPTIEEVK